MGEVISKFNPSRVNTVSLTRRPPPTRLLIYVIHGSGRDDGVWIQDWRNSVSKHGNRVAMHSLRYKNNYPLSHLILDIDRPTTARQIADDYNLNRSIEKAYSKIAMVGYSNGTKIIAKCLICLEII